MIEMSIRLSLCYFLKHPIPLFHFIVYKCVKKPKVIHLYSYRQIRHNYKFITTIFHTREACNYTCT